jgi:AraC-like DNA-binding protein
MTLIFTEADWEELHQQAPVTCLSTLSLNEFEELTGVPEHLGRGYDRDLELSPGMWLGFSDCQFHQDFGLRASTHDHPIQIIICLSGYLYSDIYPAIGGNCSYFSGSGISPAYIQRNHRGQQLNLVSINIEPELLDSAFLSEPQRHTVALKQLFRGDDWKVTFYPRVTPEIRSIAQQMWDTPYQGALRRVYLQAKVMELLVVYLDLLMEDGNSPPSQSLKPETIACLHRAKQILETRLEHPPSILELSEQLGLSDRTLLRGFKQLFGTTVIGYSMQQRLKRSESLLRQGDRSVAEVARLMGYGHLGHFAAVFKRQFGITPSQCVAGKKSVL